MLISLTWAIEPINCYCLASAMPDLWSPDHPKLALIVPTHRGMAKLS